MELKTLNFFFWERLGDLGEVEAFVRESKGVT
jgi:hypothetical protein